MAKTKCTRCPLSNVAALVQGGVVLWDGHGSNDCRVGLTVSQEDADALRCVHSLFPVPEQADLTMCLQQDCHSNKHKMPLCKWVEKQPRF